MAGNLRQGAARPRDRATDRTHSQGGVNWPWRPQQDGSVERPASLAVRGRFRIVQAAARGADPLAHPVDRGAELRRRRGAGRADLERRQGARLGLGRRPPGAGVRQDPGAAGKRNQPAAEPDPSLHQPAEPGTVRRNPAAARSGAGHADHARLDRPDAVRLGGAARAASPTASSTASANCARCRRRSPRPTRSRCWGRPRTWPGSIPSSRAPPATATR